MHIIRSGNPPPRHLKGKVLEALCILLVAVLGVWGMVVLFKRNVEDHHKMDALTDKTLESMRGSTIQDIGISKNRRDEIWMLVTPQQGEPFRVSLSNGFPLDASTGSPDESPGQTP